MTSAENPEGMASHPLTAALPAFHLSFSLFSAMPFPSVDGSISRSTGRGRGNLAQRWQSRSSDYARQISQRSRRLLAYDGRTRAAGATDARKARLRHGPGLLPVVPYSYAPHSQMAGGRPRRPGGHRQPGALGLGGAGRYAGGGEPAGRPRGDVDRQPAAIPRYRRLRQPRIRQQGRDFSYSRRAG